jgi:hypothetical protein
MSARVRVLIADDVDYDELIAEVQVDGDCVLVLSQEGGELMAQFDHSWVWSKSRKEIRLSEIKLALEEAEACLRKMRPYVDDDR